MSDEQPRFDAYIAPLFKLLIEHPAGLSTTEAYNQLAELLNLNDEHRAALLPSGTQPAYQNRIGWAHDRLKRAGLTQSVKRGVWQVTDKGRQYFTSYKGQIPEAHIQYLAQPERTEAPSPIFGNTPLDKEVDEQHHE